MIPSEQQRVGTTATTAQMLHYLSIELMSIGVIIQIRNRCREGCHKGPHGPKGRGTVGINVVHYSAHEEGLMRYQEPYPQHEQYARYTVNGAYVGQLSELLVVGCHA